MNARVSHVEADVGSGFIVVTQEHVSILREYLRAHPGASSRRMARVMPWYPPHPVAFIHRVLSAISDEVDRGHFYENKHWGSCHERVYRRSFTGGHWWLKTHPPAELGRPDNRSPWHRDPETDSNYPHPRRGTIVKWFDVSACREKP